MRFFVIQLIIVLSQSILLSAYQQDKVQLTIRSTEDALIYLNDKAIGVTKWSGEVKTGKYRIRIEKVNYFTKTYEVIITKGKDVEIDLFLTPKTGSLYIETDPPQAMIRLNDKVYGFTPKVISDLPYGQYSVTLEKPEFTKEVRQVIINDVKPFQLQVSLYSGKDITFNSKPEGAKVYINQKYEGDTPLKINLKFGFHLVKIRKDNLAYVKNLEVFQSTRSNQTYDLVGYNDPFENNMVFVKGGSFIMGDSIGEGNKEEQPIHKVTLNDFYISKFEVTQAQWNAIYGHNPSHFKGCDDCPVERVSWLDAVEFISILNELTGQFYRLPTEAEWEYAAKGGQKGKGYRYAGNNNINFVSWYKVNSGAKTHPVGTLKPNELGLYDMSGNVWEWVYDWFELYTDSPKINPTGPKNGEYKIVKGGSWFGHVGGSRISTRASDDQSNRRSYIGFRLALSAE
jgi:formylglycine-generating enzyme required for sulfatase activity